ncbi:DUF4406 domain-containing protein [Eubacterium sp. AB3007]|uniref:DUF7768 domain-containing protein n=1 Tax=Eubacterium sp. AB3007 TaxID=1392487 RepID=UPI000AC716B8|nr:DUF4406 domain-containing protein [Eubacterium sp. AB3007]
MANNKRTYRPLVYICSPLSGDVEGNMEKVRRYCRFALEQGMIPLAPQLMYPQFMDDRDLEERNLAIYMDMVLMGKCRELWVFGEVISEGMRIEITRAKKRRQPIRYFNEQCQEVMV